MSRFADAIEAARAGATTGGATPGPSWLDGPEVQLSVRVPEGLRSRVAATAVAHDMTVTALVHRALLRAVSLLTALELPSGRYATTCSWWWRLTSAFAGHRRGALTRRLEGLDRGVASALRQTVRALPAHLEIVELRRLIPAMGLLAQDHAVNQLAAEAIAAAYLETSIEVEIDSPQIRVAAHESHIGYHVTA